MPPLGVDEEALGSDAGGVVSGDDVLGLGEVAGLGVVLGEGLLGDALAGGMEGLAGGVLGSAYAGAPYVGATAGGGVGAG